MEIKDIEKEDKLFKELLRFEENNIDFSTFFAYNDFYNNDGSIFNTLCSCKIIRIENTGRKFIIKLDNFYEAMRLGGMINYNLRKPSSF